MFLVVACNLSYLQLKTQNKKSNHSCISIGRIIEQKNKI